MKYAMVLASLILALAAGFVIGQQSLPMECEDSDGIHWVAGPVSNYYHIEKYVCHVFRAKRIESDDPKIPKGARRF